jgi:hypothetical protein
MCGKILFTRRKQILQKKKNHTTGGIALIPGKMETK